MLSFLASARNGVEGQVQKRVDQLFLLFGDCVSLCPLRCCPLGILVPSSHQHRKMNFALGFLCRGWRISYSAKVILPAPGANMCCSWSLQIIDCGVLGTCDIEVLLMYELYHYISNLINQITYICSRCLARRKINRRVHWKLALYKVKYCMSPPERWKPEDCVRLMSTSAIQPYGLPLRQTEMKMKGMWNQLSIKAVRAFLQILRRNYAICCKTRHLPPRWCSESMWANTSSLFCVPNRAYFLFSVLDYASEDIYTGRTL